MRAANNLMLDRHRGRVRSMRRDQDWAEAAAPAEIGIDDAPDAERSLLAREALERAHEVLARLGGRVDAIFRRYRLDGVTIDQVAREFGVSRSTVENTSGGGEKALGGSVNRLVTRACICVIADSAPYSLDPGPAAILSATSRCIITTARATTPSRAAANRCNKISDVM